MPLSTLRFTERLDYRHENALAMLAMGCHNTLWALRNHLEGQKDASDKRDGQSLALAQKWMGIEDWPADAVGQEDLRTARCRRADPQLCDLMGHVQVAARSVTVNLTH